MMMREMKEPKLNVSNSIHRPAWTSSIALGNLHAYKFIQVGKGKLVKIEDFYKRIKDRERF